MTAKTVERKYTPAQEAELMALPTPITNEVATQVAQRWGMEPRRVIAKISSMKLPYARKQRAAKKVGGTATRAEIAADIGNLLGVEAGGLESAPRGLLVTLRDWIEDRA